MKRTDFTRQILLVFSFGLLAFSADAQTIDRVVIDATTPDPAATLIAAITADNRANDGVVIPIVVEFCDVDVDLTGESLALGSDRALVAGPACARGPRSPGPRIFVTDPRPGTPLFILHGDNIRIAGFRLQGPTDGIGSGSGRLERGILVWPFESPDPLRNVEIDNMEIFDWSGAGVSVRDNTNKAERGRLFNTNEDAVRIRNSFLHHNRHDASNGYGVDVTGGGYALIERNVFDENRHGITGGTSSDGKQDFTGYTARDNLILGGGGRHCSDNKWWDCSAGRTSGRGAGTPIRSICTATATPGIHRATGNVGQPAKR